MFYTFGHARSCTAPENRSGPSLGPPGVPSVHPYVVAILFYPFLAPVVGLFGCQFACRTAEIAYLRTLFHAPSRFLHTCLHFSSIRPPRMAFAASVLLLLLLMLPSLLMLLSLMLPLLMLLPLMLSSLLPLLLLLLLLLLLWLWLLLLLFCCC